jgi:hypothetical protein
VRERSGGLGVTVATRERSQGAAARLGQGALMGLSGLLGFSSFFFFFSISFSKFKMYF